MRKLWLVAVGMMAACAHQRASEIVAARELEEANAAPLIREVAELGGVDVAARGAISANGGDGVAIIGEGLWLRGKNFGRQPTVTIAGAAAPVLARTADGGIVVRVPTGVPDGAQTLRVSTLSGRADVPVNVRRYVAVGDGSGGVKWFAAATDGPSPVPQTASPSLPSAALLAFSSDGRAAYAVGPDARQLSVIDVSAQHGPASAYALELDGRAVRVLRTAAEAPVLVVLREDDVMVLSTVDAARPPRTRPRRLPAELRGQTGVVAALSADGQLLAVGLPDKAQILLLSLRDRDGVRIVGAHVVDTSVQAPRIKRVGFAPEGGTLWVLAGAESSDPTQARRPTRLHTLALTPKADGVELVDRGVQDLLNAGAPTALGVSRTRPLPSGAAIRRPPNLAQVLIAAGLPADRGAAVASAVFAVAGTGAHQALALDGVATDLAIDPLGHWAFAPVVQSAGDVALWRLRADGRSAQSHVLPLWPRAGAAPAWVEVQP